MVCVLCRYCGWLAGYYYQADVNGIDIRFSIFCLAAGTPVTVGCGLSRPIEQLVTVHHSVLSYNDTAGVLERDSLTLGATGPNDRGMRAVLRLTLADGRQLTLTPEHLVHTRSRGWVQARHLVYGQLHSINDLSGSAGRVTDARKDYTAKQMADELVIGPDSVLDSLEGDRSTDRQWTLPFTAGPASLSWETPQQRERALAFARLLGLMLTEGSLSSTQGAFHAGQVMDLEAVQVDVRLVCGSTLAPSWQSTPVSNADGSTRLSEYWQIPMPASLVTAMSSLAGVVLGRTTTNAVVSWPAVIFEPRHSARLRAGGARGCHGR